MARKNVPSYCLHRASGQAYVTIDGKRIYLGVHGSPESQRRYTAALADWQASLANSPQNVTVSQLTLLYLRHAEGHYVKAGQVTSQLHVVQSALRRLNRLFRETLAAEFSPKMLKTVRDGMIVEGLSRGTINQYASIIRQCWRWGVSEELVPATCLLGLQAVRDLQAGRSAAREPEPVRAVPDARIDAIREHVPAPVWGMIQLQRLTGMRPGEVLIVRGCDLLTSGDVWEYRPSCHKLEHKGIGRVVMIGPAAQSVLKPFLRADLQAYLFAADADGTRPYRRDSYTNAIRRGCELADAMPDDLRNIARHVAMAEGLTDSQRRVAGVKLPPVRLTIGIDMTGNLPPVMGRLRHRHLGADGRPPQHCGHPPLGHLTPATPPCGRFVVEELPIQRTPDSDSWLGHHVRVDHGR